MLDRIQIISIAVSFVLLCVILHLIKTRRLRVEYSVVWFLTALVIFLLSISRVLLEKLAKWVGIFYPPSLLFLMGFLFSLIILLHFSLVLSRLFEMNKGLAQHLSILNWKVEELEKAKNKQN